MAKAQDVELDPAGTFADAAARAVRLRSEEVFAHAAGVLDTTDVERVHDMRVATRRLRAALEIFGDAFPRTQHRAVLADVKALADALGARRDPDVQLERFLALQAQLTPIHHPAIEVVLGRLRSEQRAGNRTLGAALARAQRSALRERLAELAGSAGG
ncbi:MAG TPA: CHAD domain-containing protein [Solirubrobacteraceae bacterium]|jgi:CHAD domain-containing protein